MFTKEKLEQKWNDEKIIIYIKELNDLISKCLTDIVKVNKATANEYFSIVIDILKSARTILPESAVSTGNSRDRIIMKQKKLCIIFKTKFNSYLGEALNEMRYDVATDVNFGKTGETTMDPNILQLSTVSLEDIRYVIQLTAKKDMTRFESSLQLLKKCCQKENVKKAIFGCNLNVTNFLITYDSDHDDIQTTRPIVLAFLRRLELTAQFIDQVYEELERKFWIIPSGSDPHEGGKQALFLENKETKQQIVYKRRSLSPDNVLTGSDGILGTVAIKRDFIHPAMRLPTMLINPEENTEMVVSLPKEATKAVTREQALKIFYQLGMRDVLTTLMGIGDLHTDNIIITDKGPLIIDAEVSFIDYSNNYIQSSVGPLKRYWSSDQFSLASSVFFIRDICGIRMSREAYADSDSPYQQEFFTGRKETIAYLQTGDAFNQLMHTCKSNLWKIQTV